MKTDNMSPSPCEKRRQYVFVLCPPHNGSTIIVNLLSSSKNTTTFCKVVDKGESQWLYQKHGAKDYLQNRWDPNYKLDMNVVKETFDTYLNNEKTIFVEKSPPTICRAKEFEEYFSKFGDVYFIISIRSPYSCDNLPKDWIQYATYQQNNIKSLKNTIVTSYEELCLNLDKVIANIIDKLPLLNDIHNQSNPLIAKERGTPIHSDKVFRIMEKESKNKVLKEHLELLDFFGYKMIE
tara:strand:+ start:13198 stop:13905 length:708 start_codon:yes stop_codon:yes gene_type:complete